MDSMHSIDSPSSFSEPSSASGSGAGPGAKGKWWPAALLSALAIAVFAPSLRFGFVYDALTQILTDTYLFDPRNWFDVLTGRVLAMDVFDFNRPLQIASLMLDAAVWGRNPFGYHLTSVLLHAANVAVVWLVVREVVDAGGKNCGGSPPDRLRLLAGMVATAVFAVHPVVAEAVCEPTYREDLLVAFFSLSGLVLAMRHAPASQGADPWRAAACIGACLLAAAAKESAIAAPLILAAYWWLFRRQEPQAFWSAAIGGSLAVVIAFLAARFLLDPMPGLINDEKPGYLGGSLADALMIQPRILAFYAQLVAFPVNLSADYGGESIRHLSLATALAALLGITAAAVLAARRDRRLLFAFAMILLPLVPVSNLVPIFRPFADRYLYVPMAGVAVALACLLDAAWLTETGRRRAVWGGLAVVAVLALACLERQKVWADSLSLWTDTYAKNPGSFTAARNAAVALSDAGRLDEAEKAAQQAIVLTNGQHASLWAILAIVLDKQGRPEIVGRALKEALDVPILADPDALMARLAMDRDLALQYKALLAKRGLLKPGKPDALPAAKAAAAKPQNP